MDNVNATTGEIRDIPLSIYKAIFDIQHKCKVTKDGKGHNSTYATLGAILHEINPILEEHNIAISQPPTRGQGCASIQTVLVNIENGEFLAETTEVPIEQKKIADAQAFGSAITYGRRYALLSILGLVTEDDDGQSARINFVDEVKKVVYCDNVDDLKDLKKYSKDLSFPKWQIKAIEVFCDHKSKVLSALEAGDK